MRRVPGATVEQLMHGKQAVIVDLDSTAARFVHEAAPPLLEPADDLFTIARDVLAAAQAVARLELFLQLGQIFRTADHAFEIRQADRKYMVAELPDRSF